jgi:hypothetical protein
LVQKYRKSLVFALFGDTGRLTKRSTGFFGLSFSFSIQVTANDTSDSASREHIRMHLRHISKAFAEGDFTDPHEVHAEVPPGVPVMKERKDKISYRYGPIANGGRVVIRTEDAKALEAVHDYLRYQITEHKTADSIAVK